MENLCVGNCWQTNGTTDKQTHTECKYDIDLLYLWLTCMNIKIISFPSKLSPDEQNCPSSIRTSYDEADTCIEILCNHHEGWFVKGR